MTEVPRLEDAEAIRELWEATLRLDQQSRQLGRITGELTHLVRRFAVSVVEEQPEDPRELLCALGAALEVGLTLEHTQSALAEALSSLSFAWSPRGPESERVQAEALASLRSALKVRARARWRPRPERSPPEDES